MWVATHTRDCGGVCQDPVPGGVAAHHPGAHVGLLRGSGVDRER